MKSLHKTTIAALALAALTTTTFAQTPQYQVTDLGAVNGESEAFAINNFDQVVGWSFLNNGTRGAILWENGRKTILSSVGGTSAAYAINDQKVIVGKRGTRAVEFTAPNQVRDFGTFGGGEGTAFGINEYGDVAGSAQTRDARWRAFSGKYDRVRGLIDLGTLGGVQSSAHDVNNVGVYAGWAFTGGPTHAALFVPGQKPQDLGTLGGPQSEAKSISDYFGVTGWSDLAVRHTAPQNVGNVKRAFLWTPEAGRKNLGEPYSAGRPVRRDGSGRSYFQIILQEGEFRRTVNVYGVDTFGNGVSKNNTVCGHAKIYLGPAPRLVERAVVAVNGKMFDLNIVSGNNPEWNLTHAWGINDDDTIVGRGFNYRTGSFRAFIARRIR